MMSKLLVEDFVRQRLSDRDNVDYFPGGGELEDICWRSVVRRNTVTVTLLPLNRRGIPITTPGSSTLWMYPESQYVGGLGVYPWFQFLEMNEIRHQPNHRYAIFQANAFDDGVYEDSAAINEIVLSAEFGTEVDGPITLVGYPINLSRLMYDVFTSIADDINKLALYQSTIGGTTDLSTAGVMVRQQAAYWMKGTIIPTKRLLGRRRNR